MQCLFLSRNICTFESEAYYDTRYKKKTLQNSNFDDQKVNIIIANMVR